MCQNPILEENSIDFLCKKKLILYGAYFCFSRKFYREFEALKIQFQDDVIFKDGEIDMQFPF